MQDWLRSQGFQVTTTLPSGMYVQASGSAAQVESTFATSLHNYSYLGKKVRANATALSLGSMSYWEDALIDRMRKRNVA